MRTVCRCLEPAYVLAICNSGLIGNLGSTIFFSQGASQGGVYVFNSPLPLVTCSAFTKLQIGTQVFLNEPWLSRSGMEIEGLGQGSGGNFPSFVTDHVALIGGNSYPLILIANAQALAGGDGTLSNLVVQTARPHQTGIFFDQDNLGNNATQWLFRNVYARGAVPSQPFKLAGATAAAGCTHQACRRQRRRAIPYAIGSLFAAG
jgi:hypothetical protein